MHHFVTDFWFSLKCDILHPIRTNESQLLHGLGSRSVLNNYISKHGRSIFLRLWSVSLLTNALLCIVSVPGENSVT